MAGPESKKPIVEKSDFGINNDLHQKMQKVFSDYSYFKNNKDFLNAFTKASEAIRKASGKNLKIENPKAALGSLENATLFLNEITRLATEAINKKEQAVLLSPGKLDNPVPPIRKVGPPVLPRDPNLKLSTADSKPSSKAPQRPPPPVPIGSSVTRANISQQSPVSKAPQRPPPPVPTRTSGTVVTQPKVLTEDRNQPSAKPRRPLPVIPQMQSVIASKVQQMGKSKRPDVSIAKNAEPPRDPNKKPR